MSDLIDRQEAINAIYHHFPHMSMKLAAMVLHEVPSAEPKKWIPVSERLPDHQGMYIVTYNVNEIAYISTDYYFSKGFADRVTAWMPLPEPYKEENNG